MNPTLRFAPLVFALLSVPSVTQAQTGAGTPPLSASSPQNASIPQTLKLSNPSGVPSALVTDRTQYRRGQPVRFVFRVANSAKSPLAYSFPTGQQFELTVKNTRGTEVWHWSHGRVFAQAITHLKIAPRQNTLFRADWNGRDDQKRLLPPGVYTVQAKLTADRRPAIQGNLIVSTDTDPNNMGMPTRTPADTGAIREVQVTPDVTAAASLTITPKLYLHRMR